jgi:hypothetical protein
MPVLSKSVLKSRQGAGAPAEAGGQGAPRDASGGSARRAGGSGGSGGSPSAVARGGSGAAAAPPLPAGVVSFQRIHRDALEGFRAAAESRARETASAARSAAGARMSKLKDAMRAGKAAEKAKVRRIRVIWSFEGWRWGGWVSILIRSVRFSLSRCLSPLPPSTHPAASPSLQAHWMQQCGEIKVSIEEKRAVRRDGW